MGPPMGLRALGAAGKGKGRPRGEDHGQEDHGGEREPLIRQGGRGRVRLQHLGAIAAANTGTIVGLSLGWSSAALEVLHGAQGFAVTLDQWSWVSSLYAVGAVLGATAVGNLVQSLGRRAVILAVGPVTLAAWLMHLWAPSVWVLCLGRLLVGAASGAACVACPIFTSEIAEPRVRGALSTYFEILLCIGILVVYALGKFVSVWWVNVGCLSFSVLHVLAFAWFPDTPRWHLLHGRAGQARKALRFYRGPHYGLDAELRLVSAKVLESNQESGWKSLRSPSARKAMVITGVLMALQQVTGVNAITFYASQLFQEAGAFDAYTASILVAGVELAASLVSMAFVDRLGRRLLLLVSGASMAVCTALLGAYFFLREARGQDVSSAAWLPILLVCVYMFAFCIGWGPVCWVLLGEMLPDPVKGVATGLAAAVCWLCAFLVTKLYPGLALSLGNYACYWAFSATCVVACLYVVCAVPETKGKTLDEIQEQLL